MILSGLGCSPAPSPTQLQTELAASTTVQLDGEDLVASVATPATSVSKSKKSSSMDVDLVLKKARDISVGLLSDTNPTRNQNETKLFTPASVTKLLTTATALKVLGSDFQYRTRLTFQLDGSAARDLVIVSDGDPTPGVIAPNLHGTSFKIFDSNRLRSMVEALRKAGVRRIEGPIRLVAADHRLNSKVVPEGIEKDDLRECFGSLASAFNLDENCAAVRVNTQRGVDWVKLDSGDEASMNRSLQFAATPSDRNLFGVEAILETAGQLSGLKITSLYNPQSPKAFSRDIPVVESARWYGARLLSEIRASKIELSGVDVLDVRNLEEVRATLSAASRVDRVSLEFRSGPLKDIIEATNKPSDNFLANAIFKTLGRRTDSLIGDSSGLALEAESRQVLQQQLVSWLKESGDIEYSSELNFVEGAGLSKLNRISPRALMSIMRHIRKEPFFVDLWNSLSIAGKDGSLADRMKQTVAEGVVRGKTGTMAGAYQLVGYIPHSKSGGIEYLPFVILTETTEKNRMYVREFQDRLVVKLMQSL